MLTSEQVKQAARAMGADLVGIGAMSRFEGAPPPMDTRHLFPEARAIIGLAFRIPRGYLRGIEEGTHFYQYPSMGYANINEVYAPTVLHELACLLEDHGWEGAAFRNTGRMTVSDITGDPTSLAARRRIRYSRPVAEDRPAPDVMFHFHRRSSSAAWARSVGAALPHTPVRTASAFASCSPTPAGPSNTAARRCVIAAWPACAVPVGAISGESVRVTVAGRELQWGALAGGLLPRLHGSNRRPTFLPPDAFDEFERREDLAGERLSRTDARGAAGAAPILRPGGG